MTEDFTDEQRAKLAEFDAAPPAPESHDPRIWESLTDLLPCHPDHGCTDECECTAGEVRLAAERLVMAERLHQAECEGDGCCDRISRLAARTANEQRMAAGYAQARDRLADQERRQNLTGLRNEVVAGVERALLVERLEALAAEADRSRRFGSAGQVSTDDLRAALRDQP